MKIIPNFLGALLLTLGGLAHLYRYLKAIPASIGEFIVPVSWSLTFGIIMLVVGLLMFMVLKK